MSKISINVNKIEKQIKELGNISSNMDGIIDRMEAVISSDVMSEQTFLPLKKNIEKEMEQLKKEKRNNMLLAVNLGKITNQYKTTDSNIAKGKIKNQKVTIYTSSKKSGSKNKLSVLDKLENLWKKFARREQRFISMGIDLALLKSYIFDELLSATLKKGGFINELQDALYRFIQEHMHDSSVLGAMALLSMINDITNDVIKKHKGHNNAIWKRKSSTYCKGRYIEYQSLMTDIKYGEQNDILSDALLGGKPIDGSDNTCEVIAAYNALVSLNNGKSLVSFPQLLATFEKSGIMLDGYFGTAPDSIAAYFEAEGYDTSMLVGSGINKKSLAKMSKNYDTYIVTVYNDEKNINKQIHTMSITVEKNGKDSAGNTKYKYVLHNDYNPSNDNKVYTTLEDALNSYSKNNPNFELISVIGIK